MFSNCWQSQVCLHFSQKPWRKLQITCGLVRSHSIVHLNKLGYCNYCCLASLLRSCHRVPAHTCCLTAARHHKPPRQHILTPLSTPSQLILISLLSTPSGRPQPSPLLSLKLKAPSASTWHSANLSATRLHGKWMDCWKLCKSHGWLTSRLIITLANCLRYQFETISMGCDEWDDEKQSKDSLIFKANACMDWNINVKVNSSMHFNTWILRLLNCHKMGK